MVAEIAKGKSLSFPISPSYTGFYGAPCHPWEGDKDICALVFSDWVAKDVFPLRTRKICAADPLPHLFHPLHGNNFMGKV